MPDKNTVVLFEEPDGLVRVEAAPLPQPPEDGLLVRTELAGICATDLHLYRGEIPGIGFPVTPGHELVGIVEHTGPGYKADALGRHVREGDRVVVMPATPCGVCSGCKMSEGVPGCSNWDVIGFSNPYDRPGGDGLAQYVLCPSPRSRVFVTEAPPEAAVLTEPAATPVEGIRRIGLEFGDSVLVQGTGTVGLLAIAAAAALGAGVINAVGGPARRLELATQLGAETTIDISATADTQERAAQAIEASPYGKGYDLVIECAGRPQTIPEGLSCVRKGGRYLELGHFSDVGSVDLNPYHHLLSRYAKLMASSGYSARSFHKALQLTERLCASLEQLVTHVLPLSRALDAITALTPERGWKLDGREAGKIALDPWA